VRADLDDLVPRAQAGQRQRRIAATGQDQVQLPGRVVEEVGHAAMNALVLDEVVIVQHQGEVDLERGEVANEPGQDAFEGSGCPPAFDWGAGD
jgi:hypothetical protein